MKVLFVSIVANMSHLHQRQVATIVLGVFFLCMWMRKCREIELQVVEE